MLSLFVRTLTIRGNQGRPRCFPSYAFSLLRADGGPIAKIKSGVSRYQIVTGNFYNISLKTA
jgi:hypothetical protein